MASPIIYTKNLANDVVDSEIDFSNTLDRFSFRNLVHRTNLARVEQLAATKETAALVPDLVASTMAQLQDAGFLTDDFLRIALESCHDILIDRGYEHSFLTHLHDNLDSQKDHIILVAGCQLRQMLYARVDAALSILRKLEVPFKVVFCGKNPGTHVVRLSNESREMEAYFNFKRDAEPLSSEYRTFKVEVDENSHSTKTNIEEFLKKEGVITGEKRCSIYIASSLFHLLRLSSELESQLVGFNRAEYIDRLILCGAENSYQPNEVASSRGYVKAMMFDLVSYLISKESTVTSNTVPKPAE